MNKYKLSKAGINAREGIQRFGGDDAKYEQLLERFLQDTHFEEMCTALSSSDKKRAFEAAHALKGMAGNLSMNVFHEDMKPLVEGLRADDLEEAAKHLDKVKEDYKIIVSALKEKE